jgi:hypothetical protein
MRISKGLFASRLIAIAPQNPRRRQAKNAHVGAEIARFETINPISAAQNGDRLNTAAVMIG